MRTEASDLAERLRASAAQARAIDRSELLREAADWIDAARLSQLERTVLSAFLSCCDDQLEIDGVEFVRDVIAGLIGRMK